MQLIHLFIYIVTENCWLKVISQYQTQFFWENIPTTMFQTGNIIGNSGFRKH